MSDLDRRGVVLSVKRKTKALISFAVTAKLICVFVFAYAKSRFSHNEAHFLMKLMLIAFSLFLFPKSICHLLAKECVLSMGNQLKVLFLVSVKHIVASLFTKHKITNTNKILFFDSV